MVSQRAPRTAAPEARARIVAAARALVCERPFSELTVDDLMARADLARTVFYRHYDGTSLPVLMCTVYAVH